jgi:D-sedoheptulose 7-phosphate isomerase
MTEHLLQNARAYLIESQKVMGLAAESDSFLKQLAAVTCAIVDSLKSGAKVMLAGNGGSAADAQHIAGEFLSRLNFDRAPLPAIALTVDTSVLTAVGNDYGYEQVFERQVSGLGRPGDVFIGISTSGRSPNILRALRKARELGITTIAFSGAQRTEMWDHCDMVVSVPSTSTPLIQQLHITAAHIICGAVERELFSPNVVPLTSTKTQATAI